MERGGYASYIDEYNNVKWMETRYFDKQGRLILRSDKGFAVIKNEYDAYGQQITQTYYDASDSCSRLSIRNINVPVSNTNMTTKGIKCIPATLGWMEI